MKRIVITGMGVTSPIGTTKEEFFKGLREGRNGIDGITNFNPEGFPVKIAGEVRDLNIEQLIQEHIELSEIKDRKIFFGFAAANEALRDANLNDCTELGLNLGVSLESICLEDVAFYLSNSKGPRVQTPLDVLNRLLIRSYKLRGPSYINSSACVASTAAIGQSFQKIRAGEVKIMLAGGYDSMVNPLGIGGFALLGALSAQNDNPKSACRPYDKDRNGTVLGEGAGMLVIEDLEHAKKRGANIHAEIVGYGSSMDAYKVTDPHPEGLGAAISMNRALNDAGIGPKDIDYINSHGTSTPKNDVAETLAVKKVFGEHAYKIPLSSIKSMMGHLIGAAGAVETCASIFTLTHNIIPPTINFRTPDPECDLNYTPNKAVEWNGNYILKNSFAFGGQNATLILKRYRD